MGVCLIYESTPISGHTGLSASESLRNLPLRSNDSDAMLIP